MSLGSVLTKSGPRSDRQFFLLVALTWVSFIVLTPKTEVIPLPYLIGFAFGAAVISYLTLKLLGYFNPLRLLPRKSDPLLVLFAVPFGGLMQQALTQLFLGISLCPSAAVIIVWAPVYASAVFGTHYLLVWFRLKLGRKRKVVLNLLPEERATVVGDFSNQGVAHHIEFLTMSQLKEAYLKGTEHEIDLILISRHTTTEFKKDLVLLRSHLLGIPVIDYREACSRLTGRIRLSESDLWSYLAYATPQTPLLRQYQQLKLLGEPILALIVLLPLLPLFFLVAALVKVTSEGPVFYTQKRTGYRGRTFTLIKFRTMSVHSESEGPRFSNKADARVTPIGGFLRRSRIDELPQLINVFFGQMSFFGPRPERPEMYRKIRKDIPLFYLRTLVRPGISGWAQVCDGHVESIEDSKTKLEYDLFYIRHMSPRLDTVILLKTLKVVLFGVSDRSQSFMIDTPVGIKLTAD